jgi:DNA (cytosine-5)-methyltransferase 1
MTGLVVDLFAGGGGASVGIEAALGRTVDIAINHDAVALAVHKANHPHTRHLTADIWEVRTRRRPRSGTSGRAALGLAGLHALLDRRRATCRGDRKIRTLAWAVVSVGRGRRARP